MARWLACSVAVVLGFVASPAQADPQISGALLTGGGLMQLRAEHGPKFATYVGGRFDVLLLRERAGTMALGPYVDVASTAFSTFESGGGLEWLVPAGDTAFILSGGAFGRTSRFGFEPGAAGTIFWGSKSYNYQSIYSVGVGLFVQGRYGFDGPGKQADAILGLQLDLEYVALPFLFIYEAFKH